MTIHHNLIRSRAAEYNVEKVLDPDRNVVVSAERQDLIDGEQLNVVLDRVEASLRRLQASDRAVHATKDIIMELACNTLMHGTGKQPNSELLVVSVYYGPIIAVWLFGQGRKSQIDRLKNIIKAIYNIAKPPKHRAALLKRRNRDLLRNSTLPASKSHGGGAGMLTIAALSSDRLRLVLSERDSESFLLLSTI